MPETDPADDAPATLATAASDRYAALDLAHGDTVIYDRRNPRAWLQSDGATTVSRMT